MSQCLGDKLYLYFNFYCLKQFWDNELEATACEHIQYCHFEHDKCRATESYIYPGQNIRRSKYLNYPQVNITRELYEGILDWFQEYKNIEADIIDKFERRPDHKQYGHFTVMSKDNNDRVGCCYITYEEETDEGEFYNHMFTCNYRETNLIGRPIYKKGQAISECDDFGEGYEKSFNFSNLCTNKLLINDVQLDETSLLNDIVDENLEMDTNYYCKIGKTKCGKLKHIGCEGENGFEVNPSCQNIVVQNMTGTYKATILKEHNKYRNLIASGLYKEFPAASKMLKMVILFPFSVLESTRIHLILQQWDNELQDVACKHVQYCQALPSQCHATKTYDTPGQNLYHTYSTRKLENHATIFKIAVSNWFEQSNATSPDIIDSYEAM